METRDNKKSRQAKTTRETIVLKCQFDPSYQGDEGEINTGVSETIPDMSLSIPQLLQNHARGVNSDVHENEQNYFDTEIPQIDDLTDLDEYRQELKERMLDIDDIYQEEMQKIKERRKALEKEAEKPPNEPKSGSEPDIPKNTKPR